MARTLGLPLVTLLLMAACSHPDPDTRSLVTGEAGERPPLKQWMSANASPALKSANYQKLTSVFQSVPAFAPEDPQFASWNAIAASGAEAAAKRDLEGVRLACQACHRSHRGAYRIWVRGR